MPQKCCRCTLEAAVAACTCTGCPELYVNHTYQKYNTQRQHVPYTTVHITHPPEQICHGRYPHSWNGVSVPKKFSVGNISPRAFRRRTVRSGHPLGCRAIELAKPPRRGSGIHRRIRHVRTYIFCKYSLPRVLPRK